MKRSEDGGGSVTGPCVRTPRQMEYGTVPTWSSVIPDRSYGPSVLFRDGGGGLLVSYRVDRGSRPECRTFRESL